VAKYTADYSHLERCTPTLPNPYDTSIAPEEVYKSLESPKHYYATVADSIPSAQAARLPQARSAPDMEPLYKQASPQRQRGMSRTGSIVMQPNGSALDPHISAHEPRAFPGLMHERARRQSLRISSGSDGTAPDMGSSAHLVPALAKMSVREEMGIDGAEDSE
jgi:hypothetical protein